MGRKIVSPIVFSIFVLAFLFSGIALADWVDYGFKPDARGGVLSIAVQSDGKIVANGTFGQKRIYPGRLNEDGTLDTTFKPVETKAPYTAMALQADGKILLYGYPSDYGPSRLVRLNADGSLDTTFTTDADYIVSSIAIQTDGKILVGGDISKDSHGIGHIARLNADGSLDGTFIAPLFFDLLNSDVWLVALQTDGKVLVGGTFTFSSVNQQDRHNFARLNPDGSLDETFNPEPSAFSRVSSIVMQADGKILVGGSFTSMGGETRNNMARLNADGSADATFNPDADSLIRTIAVQADGKILVGGDFTTIGGQPKNHLARLNEDGTLDTTFKPDPDETVNDAVTCIAVQADSKILVGGYFTSIGGIKRSHLVRLNADAPSFSAQEYLPLYPGTIWRYLENGERTVTRQVLKKKVKVNGVETIPVKFIEENITEYLTNDSNGIFLHRQYQPNIYVDKVGWVDVDVTFIPPVKLTEDDVWIGQRYHSEGIATAVVWPMGIRTSFEYTADSAVQAEKKITVPAGTLDTVRYRESLLLYNSNSSFSGTVSATRYLAKGIGVVQDIGTDTQGASSTFQLVSMSLPGLTLLAPNGGETVSSGGTFDITWQSTPEMTFFKLKYSVDDGMTWISIPGAEHVIGNNFLWMVPVPIQNKKSCRIKVSAYNSADMLVKTDISEAPFTVEVLKVTSPDDGTEVWTSGELRSITWTTNETIRPVAEVQLYYTKNNGLTWLPITTIAGGNPGTYGWTVPPLTTTKTNCKVKAVLKDSAGKSVGSDASDQVFTVQPLP